MIATAGPETTPGPAPELIQVTPNQLIVDPRVQRSLDGKRVASIAADFQPDEVGVIHVSARDDGTYHTIDGQHRMAAAKAVGRGDIPIDAVLYRGLTTQQEAAKFLRLNNTKQVQPLDKFLVRVQQGDPIACSLSAMLDSHGWTVQKASANGAFFAVSALEAVYKGRVGGDMDACDALVAVATGAWGHDSAGLRAEVVAGLGSLLREHPGLDKSKLVAELARMEGGPLHLIGRARGLRDIRGGRLADAMAEILTNVYNKRRHGVNRLPQWGTS